MQIKWVLRYDSSSSDQKIDIETNNFNQTSFNWENFNKNNSFFSGTIAENNHTIDKMNILFVYNNFFTKVIWKKSQKSLYFFRFLFVLYFWFKQLNPTLILFWTVNSKLQHVPQLLQIMMDVKNLMQLTVGRPNSFLTVIMRRYQFRGRKGSKILVLT